MNNNPFVGLNEVKQTQCSQMIAGNSSIRPVAPLEVTYGLRLFVLIPSVDVETRLEQLRAHIWFLLTDIDHTSVAICADNLLKKGKEFYLLERQKHLLT